MLTFYQNQGVERGFSRVNQPSGAGLLVVYGDELGKSDVMLLHDSHGLAAHVVNDVFDIGELPRIEKVDAKQYVFLRNPEMKGAKVITRPVLFVVNEHVFACLSPRKGVSELLVTPPEDSRYVTPQTLLHEGMLTIVKRYESVIDETGNRIAKIEKRMRSHEVTNDDFYGFVTMEGNLNRSKMNLLGILTVAERLIETALQSLQRETLDDIRLFTKQLLAEVDSHIQAIDSIRNAYTTVANNTLNQRMKLLTALTLLVALPNVFYGMFGMNVQLPFMHEQWAYAAIVGFTALLIVVTYWIAKKLRIF